MEMDKSGSNDLGMICGFTPSSKLLGRMDTLLGCRSCVIFSVKYYNFLKIAHVIVLYLYPCYCPCFLVQNRRISSFFYPIFKGKKEKEKEKNVVVFFFFLN